MGERRGFVQHVVPEPMLIQIGDITVSFATLESMMRILTGCLIAEHQRIGQIITAELSFKNLRALLESLYIERHAKDDDYATLRSLNQRAAELEEKRNRITHSVWAASDVQGTVTRVKTTAKEKRGVQFAFERMDVAGLKGIADDMKHLASEYQRLWISLIERKKAINNPFEKIW